MQHVIAGHKDVRHVDEMNGRWGLVKTVKSLLI